MSVDLSVSGGVIEPGCLRVINALARHNIASRVTSNTSIMPSGALEHGCVIRLGRKFGYDDRLELSKAWSVVKDASESNCAHLQVHGKYDGCLLDYLKDSACPY